MTVVKCAKCGLEIEEGVEYDHVGLGVHRYYGKNHQYPSRAAYEKAVEKKK